MASVLSPFARAGCSRSHGTGWPSRSYRSRTAAYTRCPVARAHRSRALPDAPQTKHCHTPRPRCAENDRLAGAVAPCNGHAPRTCWSVRSRGCQRSSSSPTPRRTSRRAWRKSISGMTALLRPEQRRGTRFVFLVLTTPEAALVERLALAPQVEDGPGQPRRQDGQRLALTALAGLPLLPAPG